MKTIKYYLVLTVTLFSSLNFISCSDDDGYSLDDFSVNLATVNPIDMETGTFYLTLDNGTTLWPATMSNMTFKPRYNQRVLLNYTLLSDQIGDFDHYIKVNSISNILTKEIIELTPENEKEIGDDPIKILTIWPGDNYLNIRFGINVGGTQIKHTINLVKNELWTSNDADIVLELRHNANGDPEKYGETGYASFDLRPFIVEGKESIKLLVKAKDYGGEEKEYSVTYKFLEKAEIKDINSNELSDNKLIFN